jgi:hypothetical protein
MNTGPPGTAPAAFRTAPRRDRRRRNPDRNQVARRPARGFVKQRSAGEVMGEWRGVASTCRAALVLWYVRKSSLKRNRLRFAEARSSRCWSRVTRGIPLRPTGNQSIRPSGHVTIDLGSPASGKPEPALGVTKQRGIEP